MIDVYIREEGPREGTQYESSLVEVGKKIELIGLLQKAKIPSIQICSFVRPDVVPQMADADELASKVASSDRSKLTGLFLNIKGFERAARYRSLVLEGCILISAHDEFLKKNNNSCLQTEIERFSLWKKAFKKRNQTFHRLMVSTAFGHTRTEDGTTALKALEKCFQKLEEIDFLPTEVTFADTTGFAVPLAVTKLCKSFRESYPQIELGFHFHDTRGMGIANTLVALAEGVRNFDSSIAGVGGCPFVKGAAGNVATEELVHLFESEGLRTGVDLDSLFEAARFASSIFKANSKLLSSQV